MTSTTPKSTRLSRLDKRNTWFIKADQRWLDYVFYLVWLGMLGYLVFAYWGQSYDDVFLAFRYAKNIEAGYGFVFNRGEHFLGTPAPLFVLLLVMLHKLLPFITIPQVGSLISGGGLAWTCMAVYQIARVSGQRFVGIIAALLIASNPFTLLILGGETPLYLAFVTSAIFCYITHRHSLVAFLLGLALMNRTEALVPISMLFGLYTLQHRRLPIRMILICVLTVMPWIVFAVWQFGSPLTNSFSAKVSQVQAGAVRYPFGLLHWLQNVILATQPGLWAALPLASMGIVSLAFTSNAWRIIVAWVMLQTVAYSVLPIPFYHWYAAQIGVLFAVLVALGAVEAPRAIWRTVHGLASQLNTTDVTRATHALSKQWLWVYRLTLVIVMLTLPITLYMHARIARGYQQAWPHGPANAIYQRAGEWFAANTSPDARIAYLEIGQIGFYSDRYIIDTLGLVTPEVSAQVAQSNWLWPMLRYKPDYIIYNSMFKDWTDSDAIFDETWFTDGFQKVAEIALPPYPTPLMIYQRKPGAIIPDPVEPDMAQTESNQPVGELFGDHVVSQRFTADKNDFAAIALLFATYNRVNRATVMVSLQDERNATIATWRVPADQIHDNQWRHLYFTPVTDSAGKTFTLTIRSDAPTSDNAITVWMSNDATNNNAGLLQYDSRTLPGSLTFRTYSSSHEHGQ